MTTKAEVLQRVAERQWFYEFELPDGSRTTPYVGADVATIHSTRWRMLRALLDREFPQGFSSLDALDIACHQGFFSVKLAQAGFGRVRAIDARDEHVSDTNLIASAVDASAISAGVCDVFDAANTETPRDVVLQFGLLYHLENPVGALRVAQKLARRVAVFETQVVPNLSGMVDWGHYRFVRPLRGIFGIVDELDEVHAPEASVTGVCLAPSVEGLVWLLGAVGFKRAEVLPVPPDGYEQLLHGKRVMVAAWNA
jgi:hypothetical protein